MLNATHDRALMFRGARKVLPGGFFTLLAQLFNFFLGQMFNANESVFDLSYPNKFVQLDLNSCTVSVLRILDQKDHQKRNDRRARIDDKLPSI